MEKSMRPKANPKRPPATSKRPKSNPMYDKNSPQSVEARSTRAMATGGKCRGMGAAMRGGNYNKAG